MSRSERRQGKVSLWKEREGWLWKKGDSVCQEAFSGGRKSAGAEVPVRRSVSVNVTDVVTQSITDDVGMSGCRPSKGCYVCGRDNGKGKVLLNIELDVLRAGLANERTLHRRR